MERKRLWIAARTLGINTDNIGHIYSVILQMLILFTMNLFIYLLLLHYPFKAWRHLINLQATCTKHPSVRVCL
jgi:hypothetical protein